MIIYHEEVKSSTLSNLRLSKTGNIADVSTDFSTFWKHGYRKQCFLDCPPSGNMAKKNS
jgi:hypothetical protein